MDNESKLPVAGAVVVAQWRAYQGSHGYSELFRLEEVVTDAQGRFQLRAWGPTKRPKGRLTDEDPRISIYKPGYKYRVVDNSIMYVRTIGFPDTEGKVRRVPVHTPRPGQVTEKYPRWRWNGRKRASFWNGKRIGLDATATLEDEADALRGAESLVHYAWGRDLPYFWAAWLEGWQQLPESLQRSAQPPGPVLQMMESGEAQ